MGRLSAATAAAVILLPVASAACGGSAGPGSGPGAGDLTRSAGCQPPGAPGATYPGARAGDCVASSAYHFIVRVDGYEALVGNWKRYTDDQGRKFICAGVNVENLAPVSQPVAASQFHLVTPSGTSEAGQTAPSNGLPARSLPTGVQQGGGVCWPDPGQGGLYAGTFEPGSGGRRGVWTISFLPG